ncbi:hypothetical protein AGMMS4957_05830 [Bacteroidia bacterium]|nr:hypothetical protein AGMMS4957_05830 [Bacteroidia bacterium]
MFLKSLTISKKNQIIREIEFHNGLNLIVDESSEEITGNGVGKTTVLKLIDFCLGADAKNIYVDPESKKQEYQLVKDFLIKNEILITLVLIADLENDNTEEIVIERNFVQRGKNNIRKINGNQYLDTEFESKLSELIFPEHHADKPTFRQIISHNIRYKDDSINNTLKTLDKYTSDVEYETLYLFLFGCEFTNGNAKQKIVAKLKQENTFKTRLEGNQTKAAYETALVLINNDIEELEKRKSSLNLNENFESDLEKLNQLKYRINKTTSEINKLNIKKGLIEETEQELSGKVSNIDLKQLETIYQQATNLIPTIQKKFNDLVSYHNQMINEKVKFVNKELPSINLNITKQNNELKKLLVEELRLSELITKSDSFEDLESLIVQMNEKYQKKGEYENIIQQLTEVEDNMKEYHKQLKEIDDELFSDNFDQIVKSQLAKFNIQFAKISDILYGEKYAIKPDIATKKGHRFYKFNAFNANLSSGKKQGEISSFDIAYTLFADEENIPCLHFLLSDKKELMHDNQLVKIGEFVNSHKIQFVASILSDKLPDELKDEQHFVLKLSQSKKLFKIENQ